MTAHASHSAIDAAPPLALPTPDLTAVWKAIQKVGGIKGYITSQLKTGGLLVTRRDSKTLSDGERDEYKRALRAEAAERKRLARLAWAAYRANNIVHVGEGGGLHWRDPASGPNATGEAPRATTPGATTSGAPRDALDRPDGDERAADLELPPLDTPQALAEALSLSVGQLRWLAYHREAARSSHYRHFVVPKRGGGQRTIWAPMPRLKAAQRWIHDRIVTRLPLHDAAHGFVTGRSIATHAAGHVNSRVIVKLDLRDFFPTVTLRRVRGLFRQAGYREAVSTLLALLCTEAPREIVERDARRYYVALGPRCLPQGAPTSPAITNALARRLDRRLAGLAAQRGFRYSRYADDLTFSLAASHRGPPGLGALMGAVGRIVGEEGFSLNVQKTRVLRSTTRQTVTGLVVNGPAAPRVSRQRRRQIRAVAHRLAGPGETLRPGETLAHWQGQAAFVCMTNPALGRRLLDALAPLDTPAPPDDQADRTPATGTPSV